MYALTLTIYNPKKLNTFVYAQLAEIYRLPSIESLIVSLEKDVEFQADKETQIYWIENLREMNRRHLFQLRFKSNPVARYYTSLFLSIDEDKQVHQLTLHFPARGDRGCSSKVMVGLYAASGKRIARGGSEFPPLL